VTKEERLELRRAYDKKWRAKNLAHNRAYFRKYRAVHRDEIKARWNRDKEKWYAQMREQRATPESRAKRKAWNDKNHEKLRILRRARAERNRERRREQRRRSNVKHREKKLARDRAYRQQNPERYKAGIARARAKKPELYRALNLNSTEVRRVRKQSAPVERVSLTRIEERDDSRCHLCGQKVDRGERSFDHLIPVLRGGAHAEWNLMVAHLRCNQKRGTRRVLREETKEEALAYIAAHSARQGNAA
jgi:5-methylcytosine-specific restriction endonuclease McrA